MKQEIEQLSRKTMKLIERHASVHDVEMVTTLSTLASRLKTLEQRTVDIEQEIKIIAAALSKPNGKPDFNESLRDASYTTRSQQNFNGDRGGATGFRIKLDWERVGKSLPTETIFLNTAAATLTQFLQRISEVFGEQVFDKLVSLRVNRGPFVSKSPRIDYLNRATGEIYANRRIPNTNVSVLTHSSTAQKVGDIKRAMRVLGFPPGFVQLETVQKSFVQ